MNDHESIPLQGEAGEAGEVYGKPKLLQGTWRKWKIMAVVLGGSMMVVAVLALARLSFAPPVPTRSPHSALDGLELKEFAGGVSGNVDVNDAIKSIANAFHGYNQGKAVDDIDKFTHNTRDAVKAQIEISKQPINAFVGECDSIQCFGCDQSGVIEKVLKVRGDWTTMWSTRQFCLILSPRSQTVTIDVLNRGGSPRCYACSTIHKKSDGWWKNVVMHSC